MKASTTTRARRAAPSQQTTRTPRVFTYARFSSAAQADGSSIVRQDQFAERWAADHGLTLDRDLRMADHGKSAFKGEHVAKDGALGQFIERIKAGDVVSGDTLVVESLDRLSRECAQAAQSQFNDIVRTYGVDVVTMADGVRYNREQLARDPSPLFLALAIMVRAHDESRMKQERSNGGLRAKCERWMKGERGFVVVGNTSDPKWLQWDAAKKAFVFNDKVTAVRRAIQLYKAGHGTPEVARVLDREGLALSASYPAHYLQKIVRNPALMGVREVTVEGELYRLADYYPAAISKEEYETLQAMVDGRRGVSRGRSDTVAVLTGLTIAYCGACGSVLVGQHLRSGKGTRRIRCAHHHAKAVRCPGKMDSCSAEVLERIVMDYCSTQSNLDALFEVCDRDDARATLLDGRRAELARLDRKIGEYEKRMDDEDDPLTVTERKKLRQFEAEHDAAVDEIARLERELKLHVKRRVSNASQWKALVRGVVELDPDARLKARALVRETFSKIEVWMKGPSLMDRHLMAVRLTGRNGVERVLLADRRTGKIIGYRDTDHVNYTVSGSHLKHDPRYPVPQAV